MKRFVPLIILLILLGIAGGVVYGFIRGKQKRDAQMNEFYLCEARFNEEQYESAARLLEAFVQEHPKSEKSEDAHYYLATSLQKLGENSRAMTAWNKLIDTYPETIRRPDAFYYLGVGHRELKQYDKAMENYRIVVDRYTSLPVAAGAWYGMGRIHEEKGDNAAALAAYANALEKNPNAEFALDAERRWGNINLEKYFSDNVETYKAKRGDSLVRIASKFRLTPERLMKLNGLTSHMLQSGQVLRVVKADFRILVDLAKFKLFLNSGDKVIKKYSVASGKPETPTPLGSYKVTEKLPNPVWYSTLDSGAKEAIPPGDPRNELGTRWIGFKPAYGVHGTIYPSSIGKAESKGCIRMNNVDVEELYDLVVVGTPVKITPGENMSQ